MEMFQQVKVPATKPDDQSSITRIHMVIGENFLTHAMAHMHAYNASIKEKKNSFLKFVFSGLSAMAHRAKVFAAKPKNFSLIPRAQRAECQSCPLAVL